MDATMTLRDEPTAVPPAAPLALRDAIDASRCGHKAATLAALRNAGHNVPDGFVIPVDGTRDPAAVGAALAALGPGRYAVRSSGLAEDLAEASFAGQYDSILGARDLDEVLRAIERVRASGHSDRATAYREHGHLEDAPLGVLVQRQIEADAAGVMFSHNPVTGDDEVVIEAVRGLGDRLLEGEQSGDRWIGRGTAALAAVDTGCSMSPRCSASSRWRAAWPASEAVRRTSSGRSATARSTCCRRAPSPRCRDAPRSPSRRDDG
jgi:phosphoenolpyruvate synthase/pyruvate phosphate dikinase